MKIHDRTVADALASLKSGLAGLSDAEAQRRLGEFGEGRALRRRKPRLLGHWGTTPGLNSIYAVPSTWW